MHETLSAGSAESSIILQPPEGLAPPYTPEAQTSIEIRRDYVGELISMIESDEPVDLNKFIEGDQNAPQTREAWVVELEHSPHKVSEEVFSHLPTNPRVSTTAAIGRHLRYVFNRSLEQIREGAGSIRPLFTRLGQQETVLLQSGKEPIRQA